MRRLGGKIDSNHGPVGCYLVFQDTVWRQPCKPYIVLHREMKPNTGLYIILDKMPLPAWMLPV